jgi:hypothetical protein
VTGAFWIVCGKLDERQRRVRHGPHDTPSVCVRRMHGRAGATPTLSTSGSIRMTPDDASRARA